MSVNELSSKEPDGDDLDGVDRSRDLQGVAVLVVAIVGIIFSAFQMWIAAYGYSFRISVPYLFEIDRALQPLQVHAIHVAFALILAFLLFPGTRGTGPVASRLSRVWTRLNLKRGKQFVRWAVVDPNQNRVAPADIVLIILSVLPATYIVTEFDEIRELAVQGLDSGRPLHEVYPVMEPLVSVIAAFGIPLDEVSYAFLLGCLGIVLVLEATRRTLGWLLMGLVSLFIIYARFGYLIPRDTPFIGSLAILPGSWDSIVFNLWYTVEAGIHSTPVSVSVRFIYIFILFGSFLKLSGAGKWFIDLAYALTGTLRGGPAKASTVSSGFMGMLSGSSVANTVTTGAFTIPLMKRSGYSPEFSGAVESSASSGGQMLPPVMGAAAFLIVEFTGTPYSDVIIAATLPAIAFFFGMWVMVHFEAVRSDIGGLPRTELPNGLEKLKSGWFYLVPLFALLYFLVIANYSINNAGWLTIVLTVAIVSILAVYNERYGSLLFGSIIGGYLLQTWSYATAGTGLLNLIRNQFGATIETNSHGIIDAFVAAAGDLGWIAIIVSVLFMILQRRPDAPLLELDDGVKNTSEQVANQLGRPSWGKNPAFQFGTFVLRSMDDGARTATTVVIAVAAAGVVPGVISVTGLGPNLASLINTVSGGSILALLGLTGVASVIFGMGMPTTAMYVILVAMLGGPIGDIGIWIVAAHLFILYFGLMADVTPPVAVAAFAGAGVANAKKLKTAVIAFMLSLNKILVPFAFVFSPGILLVREVDGEWGLIGWSDVLEVSYFLPEVVVPVLGMFIGVYAMGVAIIGYQYSQVSQNERVGYILSSALLMIPEVLLLLGEGVFGIIGIEAGLVTFEITFALRLVGLILLAGLSSRNRTRSGGSQANTTASS